MNDYKHSHTDARWLQFFSIMGIPNEKSTLEALNNYQGYDVVVREMISKEIDRQYSFMKWNIVVQTFLFGAITQLKNDKYLWVIIVIGLLASISSFITYWASEAKIKRILYFWDGYRKFKGLSYFAFPPVWTNPTEDTIPETEVKEIFGEYKLGWSRKLCLKLILPKSSPFIFILAWVLISYGDVITTLQSILFINLCKSAMKFTSPCSCLIHVVSTKKTFALSLPSFVMGIIREFSPSHHGNHVYHCLAHQSEQHHWNMALSGISPKVHLPCVKVRKCI